MSDVKPGPAIQGPSDPTDLTAVYEQGLQIEAKSQWQLARRRFFRHKLAMTSIVILMIIFGAAIFAEQITPYSFSEQNFADASLAPTFTDHHYFGTDQLGRDYFSRVIFGIRTSARVAFLVAFLSTVIGTIVGAVAGYFGGWVDNLLMRLTDLVLTLPVLAVLLVASALLGQGSPYRVAVILALVFWTSLARIVRGTFLSLREKEYVEAAKALGASDIRIMVRHMLPNSLGPIIVNATLVVATAILVEAVLSFLGFGVQPPTPALGTLIAKGQGLLRQWWLVTFPGLTIVFICLCINFIGDGLRDALDPTQRRTSG
ncbi:MAG: glutathione transport system permease protein [Actinomycetota bacterium]|jgi:peptide/nickel transport system permease protein|nr:glutathione transport system permease protein [Actinomycetota bacterium]